MQLSREKCMFGRYSNPAPLSIFIQDVKTASTDEGTIALKVQYQYHVTYSFGNGSTSPLSYLVKTCNQDEGSADANHVMSVAKATVKKWIKDFISGTSELVIRMSVSPKTWSSHLLVLVSRLNKRVRVFSY